MNVVNQNSAINALKAALIPGNSLIDSRSEKDLLHFLSEFATLINFYDQNNELNGDWMPFLLKDPVFLLATISKTNFLKLHTLYVNTCNRLETLLPGNEKNEAAVALGFNKLFEQLTSLFMLLKKWIYFMQNSGAAYELKEYVIYQTKNNYSSYFWALIALQQNLSATKTISGIKSIDTNTFYFFEDYDEQIWKQNKDKSPYLQVLNINYKEHKDPVEIFKAIKNVGNNLFNFLHTIIEHSASAFEQVKAQKSSYPDTLLLRTFVALLKTHQQQLNEITGKHLDFYYNEILKQSPSTGTPDSVLVSAALSQKTAAFTLPTGTLFNAGADAQKNPVLFSNTTPVSLNPAIITEVFTLAKQATSGLLCLQNIANTGTVQKDENGQTMAWQTLGISANIPSIAQQPGIAIASPMFFLREGNRKIIMRMAFSNRTDATFLNGKQFYLSTASTWLEVTTCVTFIRNKLIINLSDKQPPIVPFQKNPDGLVSEWPMFKIVFGAVDDLADAPQLKTLKIDTIVHDCKNFQLYNNNGALSTKTPFQPFGPAPLINANFIIGNNEIFSKPLEHMVISLEWNALPDNFATYYQQYNAYINKYFPETVPPTPPPLERLGNWVKKQFNGSAATQEDFTHPFNDHCFTVGFSSLINNNWQDLVLKARYPDETGEAPQPVTPVEETTATKTEKVLLFHQKKENKIDTYSRFIYDNTAAQIFAAPAIQNVPLKFADTSTSGFIKMALTGQKYGFGSAIYPNVVSDTTFLNAMYVAGKPDYTTLYPPVAPPFVPTVTAFTAKYHASVCYDFSSTSGTYPVECFLYSPFQNFTVYDNVNGLTGYDYVVNTDPDNKVAPTYPTDSIPLFIPFKNNGFLFLGMDNVVTANTISFYFEVARKATPGIDNQAANKLCFNYLSTTGWKPATVLSDSTNNLCCPGIITVNIAEDIAYTSPLMPVNKYWLAITAQNNSAVSKTVFLKTNGIKLQRVQNLPVTANIAPKLAGNTITRLQTALPQITTITQPFASFGGSAAEDNTMMNLQTSTRLKTKDRVVTREDYYRIIRQACTDVNYVNVVRSTAPLITGNNSPEIGVHIIKTVDSATEPNAFLPLFNVCRELEIQDFLNKRVGAFTSVKVSNFEFNYVQVTATLAIKPGFEAAQVTANVKQAINIFLSPWIVSQLPQMQAGNDVNIAQIATIIKGIPGVAEITTATLQYFQGNPDEGFQPIASKQKNTLIAPFVYPGHNIN